MLLIVLTTMVVSTFTEKLIPKVIKCLKENTQIPVYGDGGNIRDWIRR